MVGIYQYGDPVLCSAKKGFTPRFSPAMLVTEAYCSYLADHGRTSTGELLDTSSVLCPTVHQMVRRFLVEFFNQTSNMPRTGTRAQLRNNWFYFPEELLEK